MRSTQRLAGIAILAAWGLCLAPVGRAMPAPGDAPPTDPAVTDNTGAARFRIPIEVPPGPGGFAPHLELAYSSRSGDGPYGIGWTLGIPEIRCSERFGAPDFASCPAPGSCSWEMTSCPKYELDSVLLVEDPANPNTYHTFVESFSRIRYVPANDSWTVEQPNGTKLIFGEGVSHRISQSGSTARWLLQRMEDAFGNKVFLQYDTATNIGSAYLASVFYGAGATSTVGPREVRFEYQDRPDPRNVYSGGVEQKITRRLREIQVFGHGQIFRRYAFGYDLSGVTYTAGRSRLSWVNEFGTDCANPAADPVASCTGLPRQVFRYRDAPGSYDNNDAYRIPFGAYPGATWGSTYKHTLPQLIGDINGDGLPDRLELRPHLFDLLAPSTMRVLINTGAGFLDDQESAAAYQASFDSLTYDQPRLDYQQIPKNFISGTTWYDWESTWMFAMCSVVGHTRVATLSEELLPRGLGAATSSYATLLASGAAPSAGWFEPRPTAQLLDVDADGRADLVVSVRLSGVDRHFDCNGTPLAAPEHTPASATAVVFRNTGSGWVKDEALARGLPPFEEVIVKSSYQTWLDEPSYSDLLHDSSGGAHNPCMNSGYLGFEANQYITNENMTAVCHVPIGLSPQFVDFNGDGYLDLAVIERDDPNLLWTGWNADLEPDGEFRHNTARTRVWIQTPNASERWARAPQYDLPVDIFVGIYGGGAFAHVQLFHDLYETPEGTSCRSWHSNFWLCGPNTFTGDSGVRIADVNGDGLADVVWNTVGAGCPYWENTCTGWPYSGGGYSGVLLNTGGGSAPYSAWCASNSADALVFGGSACPEAAAYVPPASFISYWNVSGAGTSLGVTTGWLRDLNGDGLLDFARVELRLLETKSFIQSPAGATPATRWLPDTRFDFPINWDRIVTNPLLGDEVAIGLGWYNFLPGFQIFDINGDGSADFVSDQNALLSRSRHGDLIESVDNGRGGTVHVEYAPAIQQRDAALEAAAAVDAQQPETPDGGDAVLWRSTPVVSRVHVTGDGFATATTEYRYAHPRFCSGLRSDLGFRLIEQTRPDSSKVEEYFYQDHGRAGHTSKRLVKDAGQVVHRYQASWQHVAGTIAGSISGVFAGRLAWEESAYQYAGASGALLRRILSYDDVHGYNFVREIRTERPTGTLIDTRVPEPMGVPYVVGRSARRTLTDGTTTLRDTILTYLDLDAEPTGPKLGSRRELVSERGAVGGTSVDVVELRYDAFGNRNEVRTPSPTGGERSTLLCYDGDGGWCPSPQGQSSHSALVAIRDPLGKLTRITPDPRSGIGACQRV